MFGMFNTFISKASDNNVAMVQSAGQATAKEKIEHEDTYSFHDDDKSSDDMDSRVEQFESSIVHPKMNLTIRAKSTATGEEEPQVEDDAWTPPEGMGACLSTYACKCRYMRSTAEDPLRPFRKFCQSTDFVDYVKDCGVGIVGFTPNKHLIFDRFKALLMETTTGSSLENSNKIIDSACLSVVFHGTATKNINVILKDGLDPNKPTGQCYGPGEYFSKDPTISVPYCRGGSTMVVFLVVVPPKEKNHRSLPEDYVVVKENSHQLPLGVFTFDMVDEEALRRANEMRHRLKVLNAELSQRQANVMEAQTKAYIIQLLIQEKTDLAIEKYEKHRSVLQPKSLQEISMYVHQKFDADLVPCLFPDLPEPFKAKEFEARQDLSTVEAHEQEAVKTMARLKQARNGVAQKYFERCIGGP